MSLPIEELRRALGSSAERIQGIGSWADLAVLGRANLVAVRDLLAQSALQAANDGDREAASLARDAGSLVERPLARTTETKPVLPRLRRESFRVGEPVHLFVGEWAEDEPWRPARVTSIEKAFRSEWQRDAARGFYWRVTATLDRAVEGIRLFPFSTSEPRAVPSAELGWWIDARDRERRFLDVYAANAFREWQPLWCLERRRPVDPRAMRFDDWLWRIDGVVGSPACLTGQP